MDPKLDRYVMAAEAIEAITREDQDEALKPILIYLNEKRLELSNQQQEIKKNYIENLPVR